MGVSSSKLQPQELIMFKKLPTNVPLNHIQIPERPENRRPTNVKWLIIFAVCVVILLPFMIYTLCFADPKRIVRGYDRCGNICGQQNYQWDNIPCSGKNWINYPYLQYDDMDPSEEWFRERDCVKSCNTGFSPIMGKCLKSDQQEYGLNSNPGSDVKKVKFDEFLDFGVYFDNVKWQIIISCLLSILVALGMLLLFRYAMDFVVWGILIGGSIAVLILCVFFWYLYMITPEPTPEATENTKRDFMSAATVFTFVAIFLGMVFHWCRPRIRLVILLLKEATLAVFDMPGLITVPMICVVAVLILTSLCGLTTFYMASAGTLERVWNDFYTYSTNPVMLFTMAYNFVIFLWFIQFFTGIQYMVIAGAVSKWYFSRDKGYLERPIMASVSNAFRFHLGTVALGALIITVIQVIKSIILSLIQNNKAKTVVQTATEAVEKFFKFLSKNAYIITAMHGQAFLRSGKRAAKLILQNVSDVIALNYISDFILGMAKLLITGITVLLSMGVFAISPGSFPNNNNAYIVVAAVSFAVAHVSFGVFETAIDTLFICYCEDCILNDGMARPYFMSRNLMEFVQGSKKYYAEKEKRDANAAKTTK